uniref:Uncharacterized protein n=1 Tax=Chromera velia CCMP2878 TaxID=1169474 RepID=A0A0G4I2P4_9ALVE|eukprot:Cvel_1723.t1-p1 / transcript=Cvel_1723.t1 / gene=Cvel_1723 / organism=Chromera_velia_CCMP2878 / gene_product=hypothetical protein / transcript_product=hypothetical protein / location=Cvel_scaffold62:121351-127970(+) / protein_length=1950 / sequence_SO=supercontig / SO=protein_coding / is_pseudo=false
MSEGTGAGSADLMSLDQISRLVSQQRKMLAWDGAVLKFDRERICVRVVSHVKGLVIQKLFPAFPEGREKYPKGCPEVQAGEVPSFSKEVIEKWSSQGKVPKLQAMEATDAGLTFAKHLTRIWYDKQRLSQWETDAFFDEAVIRKDEDENLRNRREPRETGADPPATSTRSGGVRRDREKSATAETDEAAGKVQVRISLRDSKGAQQQQEKSDQTDEKRGRGRPRKHPVPQESEKAKFGGSGRKGSADSSEPLAKNPKAVLQRNRKKGGQGWTKKKQSSRPPPPPPPKKKSNNQQQQQQQKPSQSPKAGKEGASGSHMPKVQRSVQLQLREEEKAREQEKKGSREAPNAKPVLPSLRGLPASLTGPGLVPENIGGVPGQGEGEVDKMSDGPDLDWDYHRLCGMAPESNFMQVEAFHPSSIREIPFTRWQFLRVGPEKEVFVAFLPETAVTGPGRPKRVLRSEMTDVWDPLPPDCVWLEGTAKGQDPIEVEFAGPNSNAKNKGGGPAGSVQGGNESIYRRQRSPSRATQRLSFLPSPQPGGASFSVHPQTQARGPGFGSSSTGLRLPRLQLPGSDHLGPGSTRTDFLIGGIPSPLPSPSFGLPSPVLSLPVPGGAGGDSPAGRIRRRRSSLGVPPPLTGWGGDADSDVAGAAAAVSASEAQFLLGREGPVVVRTRERQREEREVRAALRDLGVFFSLTEGQYDDEGGKLEGTEKIGGVGEDIEMGVASEAEVLGGIEGNVSPAKSTTSGPFAALSAYSNEAPAPPSLQKQTSNSFLTVPSKSPLAQESPGVQTRRAPGRSSKQQGTEGKADKIGGTHQTNLLASPGAERDRPLSAEYAEGLSCFFGLGREEIAEVLGRDSTRWPTVMDWVRNIRGGLFPSEQSRRLFPTFRQQMALHKAHAKGAASFPIEDAMAEAIKQNIADPPGTVPDLSEGPEKPSYVLHPPRPLYSPPPETKAGPSPFDEPSRGSPNPFFDQRDKVEEDEYIRISRDGTGLAQTLRSLALCCETYHEDLPGVVKEMREDQQVEYVCNGCERDDPGRRVFKPPRHRTGAFRVPPPFQTEAVRFDRLPWDSEEKQLMLQLEVARVLWRWGQLEREGGSASFTPGTPEASDAIDRVIGRIALVLAGGADACLEPAEIEIRPRTKETEGGDGTIPSPAPSDVDTSRLSIGMQLPSPSGGAGGQGRYGSLLTRGDGEYGRPFKARRERAVRADRLRVRLFTRPSREAIALLPVDNFGVHSGTVLCAVLRLRRRAEIPPTRKELRLRQAFGMRSSAYIPWASLPVVPEGQADESDLEFETFVGKPFRHTRAQCRERVAPLLCSLHPDDSARVAEALDHELEDRDLKHLLFGRGSRGAYRRWVDRARESDSLFWHERWHKVERAAKEREEAARRARVAKWGRGIVVDRGRESGGGLGTVDSDAVDGSPTIRGGDETCKSVFMNPSGASPRFEQPNNKTSNAKAFDLMSVVKFPVGKPRGPDARVHERLHAREFPLPFRIAPTPAEWALKESVAVPTSQWANPQVSCLTEEISFAGEIPLVQEQMEQEPKAFHEVCLSRRDPPREAVMMDRDAFATLDFSQHQQQQKDSARAAPPSFEFLGGEKTRRSAGSASPLGSGCSKRKLNFDSSQSPSPNNRRRGSAAAAASPMGSGGPRRVPSPRTGLKEAGGGKGMGKGAGSPEPQVTKQEGPFRLFYVKKEGEGADVVEEPFHFAPPGPAVPPPRSPPLVPLAKPSGALQPKEKEKETTTGMKGVKENAAEITETGVLAGRKGGGSKSVTEKGEDCGSFSLPPQGERERESVPVTAATSGALMMNSTLAGVGVGGVGQTVSEALSHALSSDEAPPPVRPLKRQRQYEKGVEGQEKALKGDGHVEMGGGTVRGGEKEKGALGGDRVLEWDELGSLDEALLPPLQFGGVEKGEGGLKGARLYGLIPSVAEIQGEVAASKRGGVREKGGPP